MLIDLTTYLKIPAISGRCVLVFTLLLFGCDSGDGDALHNNLPDDVTFTVLPTDLSEMGGFAAIGQITGIPKAHGGFGLKSYFNTNPSIPVYAMSDGVIINIRYESQIFPSYAPAELVDQEYDDFAFDILLTKTAKMHFGHVCKVAQDILDQAGPLTKGRGVQNQVEIHFKAGDILGFIGTHSGFDIGLNDTKHEHFFANPSRYPIEYRSAIPFTDFLTDDLREQVWDINIRTVEPRGGRVDYDVAGTISGNWFREGTTSLEQWSKQLIIARNEFFADRIVISDASNYSDGDGAQNAGKQPNLWWLAVGSPDPVTITLSSGKVKYKATGYGTDGTIMIEMLTTEKIQFESFPGLEPDDVTDFTSESRIYVR